MKQSILMYSILWLLVFPLSAGGGDTSPKQKVDAITGTETSFPDELYLTYTWQTFLKSGQGDKIINIRKPDYNLLNAAVFYFTNKFREERKREPFKFSAQLRDAAVYHSLTMVEYGFYDHNNKREKDMRTVLERSKYFGFSGYAVGENIDMEFLLKYNHKIPYTVEKEDGRMKYLSIDNNKIGPPIPALTYTEFAERVVDEWINSPPHRTNMLDNRYNHLGTGIIPDYPNFDKQTIPEAAATQVFGGIDAGN